MERFFKGAVTLFVLFLFVFLAACGSITTTSSTTNTTTTATTTNNQTTTLEPTTLAPTTLAPTTTITTTGTNTQITTTTENSGTTTTTTNNSTTTTTEAVATTYIFEAEYTYLDDMIGTGYSGGTYGTGVIVEDTKQGDASNGYFVSYLYSMGTTLVFEIESSVAVDNAELVLRLSAELIDFTLTSDMYTVRINGLAYAYDDMVFENVPGMQSATMLPFADFFIANVSLIAGTNTIELVTTNSQAMGGTMYSTAPMVDCIKITTSAVLTWDPYTENIE